MSNIGAEDTRIRCLIEGEAVLNARHIICCGRKSCDALSVTVQLRAGVKRTHHVTLDRNLHRLIVCIVQASDARKTVVTRALLITVRADLD